MKELVCLSSQKLEHLYIDRLTNTFIKEEGKLRTDLCEYFDELKYTRTYNKNKTKIYTVLNTISKYDYPNEIEGYYVANNFGESDIYTTSQLIALSEKYPILNYCVVRTESKMYLRKNNCAIVPKITPKQLQFRVGYSFQSFAFSSDMNLIEAGNCLKYADFKVGSVKKFKYFAEEDKVGKSEHTGTEVIYYNSDGVQFILRFAEEGLSLFKQTAVCQRKIDETGYLHYKDKADLDIGCSMLYGKLASSEQRTLACFTFDNPATFLQNLEIQKKFSTPVVPYVLGDNNDGIYSLLHITVEQQAKIDKYIKRLPHIYTCCVGNKVQFDSYADVLLRVLVGLKNIESYTEDFRAFYVNILENKQDIIHTEVKKFPLKGSFITITKFMRDVDNDLE